MSDRDGTHRVSRGCRCSVCREAIRGARRAWWTRFADNVMGAVASGLVLLCVLMAVVTMFQCTDASRGVLAPSRELPYVQPGTYRDANVELRLMVGAEYWQPCSLRDPAGFSEGRCFWRYETRRLIEVRAQLRGYDGELLPWGWMELIQDTPGQLRYADGVLVMEGTRDGD